MKKTYLAKLAIVSFTMAIAFAFMGTAAQAETGTISATVSIATPITITGDSALIFGVFTAPTTGIDFWIVNALSGVLTKAGDGNGSDLFNDDHSRGLFTINGENDAALTYDVAKSSDFSGTGLFLTSVFFTPTGSSLNNSGVLVVGVGGTVRVMTTAGSGSDAAEITLTANY